MVTKVDLPDRAFRFAKGIVSLCMELERMTGVTKILNRQLIRSGTSIGANIEEAQAAQSRADMCHKYSISCKEARERIIGCACFLKLALFLQSVCLHYHMNQVN